MGLIAIATAHGDAARVDRPLLADAAMLALGVADDRARADVLAALGHAQALAGQLDLALRTVRQIPIAATRLMALVDCASLAPQLALPIVEEMGPLMLASATDLVRQHSKSLPSSWHGAAGSRPQCRLVGPWCRMHKSVSCQAAWHVGRRLLR